jgi:TonB family protein
MGPHRIAGLFVLLALIPVGSVFAQDPVQVEGPTYIARDVEPTIKNMEELKFVMRRVYPAGYRDTGLDVTAIMWVYVEPDGTVGARQVLKSSGYAVFDQAAEQLVDAMEYTPALRGGEPLAVWINQAVRFDSGDSGRFMDGPAHVAEELIEPE